MNKSKWSGVFEATPKGVQENNVEYVRRIADMECTSEGFVKKRFYEWRQKKQMVTVKPQLPEAKELSVEDQVTKDVNTSRERLKSFELQRKYDHLIKQLDLAEERFATSVEINQPIDRYVIEAELKGQPHEAVPIIGLSDWHFEERVDSETINDLNEYSPRIATDRWNKCIQNSLKLVFKERQSSTINQMVLWLGGDFINGYIHMENIEENFMSPTQATMFAKERIVSAIDFYVKHGKFKKIVVVCNYGNHGRTTDKIRMGSGYKNSYEWMMYKFLEQHFAHNKSIQFVIPNGFMAYVDILGYTWRFMHGDSIKYNGGIGGLTVPLIKAIGRYDGQTKADYTMMGHYHNLFQATRNCFVNGSGIGFNAYAQRIGASPEEPMQAFCLVDKKYGLTIKTPIFCR
jgi:rhodanese-related sulfurtransferase